MAGYWGRPAETREVITADGWLRTGDAARVDDEGFVWIVDRVAARFVVGGRTVYPGDVERCAVAHPAVADAAVAAATGPDRSVVAAAFVVLTSGNAVTEEELLAFCRARLPAQHGPGVGLVRRPAAAQLRRQAAAE